METHGEENDYTGYIPTPQSQDAQIVSLRWEAQQLIHDLYRVLGGYEFQQNGDSVIPRKRNPNAKCLMNDDGIEAMLSVILCAVNPVMSLSNFDDEEANKLIRQTCNMISVHLNVKHKQYKVKHEDIPLIMNNIRMLVFAQIKRPVGGHETRWVTKTGIDQNQSISQSISDNGRGFPWVGRR